MGLTKQRPHAHPKKEETDFLGSVSSLYQFNEDLSNLYVALRHN